MPPEPSHDRLLYGASYEWADGTRIDPEAVLPAEATMQPDSLPSKRGVDGMDDYQALKEQALDTLYAQCGRIQHDRDLLRDMNRRLGEENGRLTRQLAGAVDTLGEARQYVAEAVARREDMGLATSAAHELLARIDGGGRDGS